MAKRESILVVDDEIGPRESLRMILKPLYEVHMAANGQEALECVQNKEIDLMTLDLKMPGLGGIDVLREIRRLNLDISIIVVTAYGNLENTFDAMRYGAIDFISKPFNAQDIIATISKLIEKRNFKLKINKLTQQLNDLRAENLISFSGS